MTKFVIWLDNGPDHIVTADSMSEALDIVSRELGYTDHADFCQYYGLTKSPFNIDFASGEQE